MMSLMAVQGLQRVSWHLVTVAKATSGQWSRQEAGWSELSGEWILCRARGTVATKWVSVDKRKFVSAFKMTGTWAYYVQSKSLWRGRRSYLEKVPEECWSRRIETSVSGISLGQRRGAASTDGICGRKQCHDLWYIYMYLSHTHAHTLCVQA